MKSERIRQAESDLQSGLFPAALGLLVEEIGDNPGDWYPHYLAGQCEKFIGNPEKALEYLKEAVRLNDKDEPSLLQALAIACQASGQYSEAVNVLRRALEADPDHLVSLNSLAMTQKLMGEPEKASHNYDLALKKLAQSIVREMTNSKQNHAFKHEPWESTVNVWLEYAMQGALYLAAVNDIDGAAWPTGEMAAREEETGEHEGLYWEDLVNEEGKSTRMFLPNFFTTFRERIMRNDIYADLLGNRSTVLGMLGQEEESKRFLHEAQFVTSMRTG